MSKQENLPSITARNDETGDKRISVTKENGTTLF